MASSITLDVIPRTNAIKVIAYTAGAQVNGAQAAVNTVTVHTGHGIAANDLFLYALAEDNILTERVFTASSVAATTVTFSGDTFSFPDKAVLVNIGTDTVTINDDSSWPLPEYDGSSITMWDDPSETNSITTKAIRPDGEIQFWASEAPLWVLSLTQGNRPVRVYRDIGSAAGSSKTTRSADAPTSPEPGDVWIRIMNAGATYDIKYFYMWTGSAWAWIEEESGEVA